jgi:hypothetical protein
MGTLEHFAPVLGLLAGVIIAKLTPYEFKQGKKYFKILQYALLVAVIGTAAWQKINSQEINLHIPIFLFFIPVGTLHHKNYKIIAGIAAIYIIITLLFL